MNQYLHPLIERFKAAHNPKRAEMAKHYLKGQFEFIGLDAKTLRSLIADFIKEFHYPDTEKLGEVALHLWRMPEREFQHAAIEIIRKKTKQFRKQDIAWVEELIIRKSWWDTVDAIAIHICGDFFKLFPEQIIPITNRWIDSDNIWLNRSALLFQLKYKVNTDTKLLSSYIEKQAGHKDFFVRKAIGWILREYSKTNKKWVAEFVASHQLSSLSRKEATKYN